MRGLMPLLLALLSVGAYAQDNDPVVMKIGDEAVKRSEFQRAYDRNKAAETSVSDYAQLYINYRLKIAEALRQKIDTTSGFRNEYTTYRDDALKKYIQDPAYEDSVVRSVYDRIKAQLKDSDILSVSHIFVRVPQKATAAEKARAKARIDSIYNVLRGGADFAEVARKCSEDYVTAQRDGKLPDFGPGATLREFEAKCYSMKAGEMSAPFESTAGYHIVLMHSRHKLEPYEEKKADLIKALQPQGLDQMVFNHAVDKLVKASGGLTREQVMDKMEKEHTAQDTELRNLIRDYREGLLSYDITKKEAWDKAAADSVGLRAYYNKNKKKYRWDKPHFKGFVIHAKDDKLLSEAKDLLKRRPADWRAAVKQQFTKDGKQDVIVTKGLWTEGENRFVDKYAFHSADAVVANNKNYPSIDVMGKMLKKGPEELDDVRRLVTSDYEDTREKQWIESLRKNTKVEIYEDVLKTVKDH
jgi:peptidyl-prolyl cis-trans isomerase SurA